MFKVQNKHLGQQVKQISSIFWDPSLEVKKYLVSNTSYTPKDDLLEEITDVSISVDKKVTLN